MKAQQHHLSTQRVRSTRPGQMLMREALMCNGKYIAGRATKYSTAVGTLEEICIEYLDKLGMQCMGKRDSSVSVFFK